MTYLESYRNKNSRTWFQKHAFLIAGQCLFCNSPPWHCLGFHLEGWPPTTRVLRYSLCLSCEKGKEWFFHKCHVLHSASLHPQACDLCWLSSRSRKIALCLMSLHFMSISSEHVGQSRMETAQVLSRLISWLDHLTTLSKPLNYSESLLPHLPKKRFLDFPR